MSDEFTMTERPMTKARGRSEISAIRLALRETLTNGRAIRVPLNGTTEHIMRARIAGHAKAEQAGSRTRRDGDALIAWLVPKVEAPK